jgi:hypothetical protein
MVFSTPKSVLPSCQSLHNQRNAVSPPLYLGLAGGFFLACLNNSLKYLSCPGLFFFTTPLKA